MNDTNRDPDWLAKMVDEVVDSVNNMTWEQARAAEEHYWMTAYGTLDPAARGFRSFWD